MPRTPESRLKVSAFGTFPAYSADPFALAQLTHHLLEQNEPAHRGDDRPRILAARGWGRSPRGTVTAPNASIQTIGRVSSGFGRYCCVC
jgi:hypothetical protein